MELIGYIVGGINLVVTIIITIYHRINSKYIEAKNSVKDEVRDAYSEFGKFRISESQESGTLDLIINRIKKLHYSSICDLIKMSRAYSFLNKTTIFAFFFFIIVVISILIGKTNVNIQNQMLKSILIMWVPIIMFVLNFIILMVMLKIESYLTNVTDRYTSGDYGL